MRKKLIIFTLMGTFCLSSYSFNTVKPVTTTSASFSCFSTFRWCVAMAEFNLSLMEYSDETAEQYVSDLENCLDDLGICADPPKN